MSAEAHNLNRKAWIEQHLSEIIEEQGGSKRVHRFKDLLGNAWPEDENLDDFLAFLDESREHQRH